MGDVNPEKKTMNLCFSIEGNIGCGKSTFLDILRKKMPEAQWIDEPLSCWQNVGEKRVNLLERYYKEPKRWGFTFQMYAILTRVQKLNEAISRSPKGIKIAERSILADKHVFSQLMKDLGYMDETEYEVFKSLYSQFEEMSSVEQMKVIYLRCPPEVCHHRTKLRQRSEEN